MKEISFYKAEGKYGFLSNFANYPIKIRDKIWPTTEHYFQGQKYAGTLDEEQVRNAETPAKAKELGKDRSKTLRPDWEKVKIDIMREALLAKFNQHKEIKDKLVATGDATLIEHTENDKFWGDGGDGLGQNLLGKLLMEIREQLKKSK
jgi:ribA/ribD-fused uncharacterized protein